MMLALVRPLLSTSFVDEVALPPCALDGADRAPSPPPDADTETSDDAPAPRAACRGARLPRGAAPAIAGMHASRQCGDEQGPSWPSTRPGVGGSSPSTGPRRTRRR